MFCSKTVRFWYGLINPLLGLGQSHSKSFKACGVPNHSKVSRPRSSDEKEFHTCPKHVSHDRSMSIWYFAWLHVSKAFSSTNTTCLNFSDHYITLTGLHWHRKSRQKVLFRPQYTFSVSWEFWQRRSLSSLEFFKSQDPPRSILFSLNKFMWQSFLFGHSSISKLMWHEPGPQEKDSWNPHGNWGISVAV